ncbi:hypothetical protein K443DRAFT_677332 [Laccaria amethystina LaAM-08-1]|uniref:Uncharacterized protein n=1 Tax=Laccaria amethystina LaAM-08-1 TaxID=1095629 RepID=A0A0C9XCV8_9AGAR|nr:hypothetical protein K443DRAFT_677332 [Laccaria amethystina LaAM-08-1]
MEQVPRTPPPYTAVMLTSRFRISLNPSTQASPSYAKTRSTQQARRKRALPDAQ